MIRSILALSILAGLLAIGMARQQSSPGALEPDHFVLITLAQPYTVPPGMVLLIGSVSDNNGGTVAVHKNGVFWFGAGSQAVHPGAVAVGGDHIEVFNNDQAFGRLFIEI